MCRKFHLTILQATNLRDVRKLFKTRAYAKISIIRSANGKRISRRTHADKHNGLNPAWDQGQAMEFKITASKKLYTVVMELYCERTFGKDGHIGEVRTTMEYLFDEASKQGGKAVLSLPIVFTGQNNPSHHESFLRFSCSFSGKRSNFMKKVCHLVGIMISFATQVAAQEVAELL